MTSKVPPNHQIETNIEKEENINQESSLNARRTVARSYNIWKIRLINYLNKVEDNDTPSRFGSCNEYTFGINENIRPPSVPLVKKNENSESKQDPKSPHE